MNDLDTVVSKLRDIHEPAAVSFWPLAPGWWALLGLLVAVPLLILGWRALRRRAKPARREALRELHQLREDYAKHGNVLRLSARFLCSFAAPVWRVIRAPM